MSLAANRLRPLLVIMVGLVVLGVASAIPVARMYGNQVQGWEAAEYSARFFFKDFPSVTMPAAPLLDTGGAMTFLLPGARSTTMEQSPLDGVMVSTLFLNSGGFQDAGEMGKVFLAWVAWAWLANAGVVAALVVLLGGPRFIRSVHWLLESMAWISVLLAVVGAVIVRGWGQDPVLFGPAYWAWLVALVMMAMGVTMASRTQSQMMTTGEEE